MINDLVPARAVAPGRIIKRELEARGWTQQDLAEIMGRPAQAVNEIVRGSKQITPETAIELGAAFGTSSNLWNNLEANYRLRLAQGAKNDTRIQRKSILYSHAPVRELVKRSWIKAADTIEELEKEVIAFLGLSSINELPAMMVNFRHPGERGPELYAQLAWLRRVEHLAKTQRVEKFSMPTLRKAIPLILENAPAPKMVANVPGLLSKLGVRMVIVPHLTKTFLDGAVIPSKSGPVVALTLRYDRLDNFWFTLMHELAHIISGHEGTRLDDFDQRDRGPDEEQADRLARNWLLEPGAYASFVSETRPHFSRKAIERFGQAQGRHPSIVLGRLQYDGFVPYKNLRVLHPRVRVFLQEWVDVSHSKKSDGVRAQTGTSKQ